MNKASLLAFCVFGLLASSPVTFAAGVDSTGPSPDSSGPTNPKPPTLPTPGTGIDNGTGTGIDGSDPAPAPGTDGTGREDKNGTPSTDNPSGTKDGPGKDRATGS